MFIVQLTNRKNNETNIFSSWVYLDQYHHPCCLHHQDTSIPSFSDSLQARELFPHMITVCTPAKMLTQIDDSQNQLGTSWAPKTTREHNNRIRLKNKNSKIRNISSSKRINCDTVLKNWFFFLFWFETEIIWKKIEASKIALFKNCGFNYLFKSFAIREAQIIFIEKELKMCNFDICSNQNGYVWNVMLSWSISIFIDKQY